MNSLTPESLADMTIDALERTAFVVAEPADEDFLDELPETEWYSRIEYSGPDAGTVYLAGSTGFLIELASSLLGVEPEDICPDREGLDALREMTNIVGGSVVHDLGGAHCKLSLGLPALISRDEYRGASCESRCVLDAEGERLEVVWSPRVKSEQKAA